MIVLHLKHRNYMVRFRVCPSKVSPSWNDKKGRGAVSPSRNDTLPCHCEVFVKNSGNLVEAHYVSLRGFEKAVVISNVTFWIPCLSV